VINCGLANSLNNEEMPLLVYPNPVIGNEITIDGLTQFNCSITDLQGKVYSMTLNENKIDVSNLSNGVYFLIITSDSNQENVKLVIAR